MNVCGVQQCLKSLLRAVGILHGAACRRAGAACATLEPTGMARQLPRAGVRKARRARQIERHIESWEVSGGQALAMLFRPGPPPDMKR